MRKRGNTAFWYHEYEGYEVETNCIFLKSFKGLIVPPFQRPHIPPRSPPVWDDRVFK